MRELEFPQPQELLQDGFLDADRFKVGTDLGDHVVDDGAVDRGLGRVQGEERGVGRAGWGRKEVDSAVRRSGEGGQWKREGSGECSAAAAVSFEAGGRGV